MELPKTIAGKLFMLMNIMEIEWAMLPWWKKIFLNEKRWKANWVIKGLEKRV